MQAARKPPSRSILWIEDEPDLVSGAAASLELDGHSVTVESDPVGARTRLQSEHFDFLIVDERLVAATGRNYSGSALISSLKNGTMGARNAGVPFVFVTGWSGDAAIDDLQWTDGFNGVIERSGDLVGEISKLLPRVIAIPGLVDPQGRPLRNESPAQRELVIKFESASKEVLDYLGKNPHHLPKVDPRFFEQMIAELLEAEGLDVTLTRRSGDRGVDIFAAEHTGFGKLLYVFECKRYSAENKVGPALVRQLRGVVDREGATCGVLVTTSTFTQGAVAEQQTLPYRLALRDIEDVTAWLRGTPMLRRRS
jgi:CheY-like chemotaxis protein